jgi:hypothetical protein
MPQDQAMPTYFPTPTYGTDPESEVRSKYKYQGEPKPAPAGQDSISDAPTGLRPWLNDFQNDIRTGSGYTLPGRVLSALGASGSEKGVPKGLANFMPGTGTLQNLSEIGQGAYDVPEHPMAGLNRMVRGISGAAAPLMAVENPGFAADLMPYAATQQAVQHGSQAAGLTPEQAEFAGNTAAMGLGALQGGNMPQYARSVEKPTSIDSSPNYTPALRGEAEAEGPLNSPESIRNVVPINKSQKYRMFTRDESGEPIPIDSHADYHSPFIQQLTNQKNNLTSIDQGRNYHANEPGPGISDQLPMHEMLEMATKYGLGPKDLNPTPPLNIGTVKSALAGVGAKNAYSLPSDQDDYTK